MLPLIIESDSFEQISEYLTDHYYLQNLVGELRPENNSIGLPAIKYLIDRAKFTHPEKSQAVFLIWDSHLTTPAGQNALLKTLEESKPYEQFILITSNHYLLLETIVSRCQVINLKKILETTPNQQTLKDLVIYLESPSKSISSSDEISSGSPKEKIKQIVDSLKQANRHFPTTKRVEILVQALECLSDLDRNINPKLAIDHFLLQSHKIIKKST